jgi:hypothetical protein
MIFAIKNINVAQANLLMNDFCAGLPSPLALLGFGDAIARRLGLTPWSVGVIPVIHNVLASPGRTKPEMQYKGSAFSPVETVEDFTGYINISMLLDIPEHESAAALRDLILLLRICGGTIQNDTIDVVDITSDGSAFRGFHRGFAMVRPGEDRAKMTTTGATEELRLFARELFPAEKQPGSGWHVPSAVGYRLIEDPETVPVRSKTRSKTVPHVFAEPMLGIAELISVRNARLTGLLNEDLTSLFWRWHADGTHVVGHPSYHPLYTSTHKE